LLQKHYLSPLQQQSVAWRRAANAGAKRRLAKQQQPPTHLGVSGRPDAEAAVSFMRGSMWILAVCTYWMEIVEFSCTLALGSSGLRDDGAGKALAAPAQMRSPAAQQGQAVTLLEQRGLNSFT
jgi:hypothetical protein